jgi:16S rRNA (guanine966-N2)-methyltransferase
MPCNKTMRITGGALVRRRFLIPDLVDENVVRPTPDRVRESLFAILNPKLQDALVLDLFAGSGAHSFEAISRGAKHATLIEREPRIASVIRENINSLKIIEKCTLLTKDVMDYVDSVPSFLADIIFLDPPYSLVLNTTFFGHILKHLQKDGIIVFRCFKKEVVNLDDRLQIERDRVYGGTRVMILSRVST